MKATRRWLTGIIALLLLAAVLLALSQFKKPEQERPGGFSQGTIVVDPAQTVGKLLVVDGDAIVSGRVDGWLAVIGGSVFLRPGGRVEGPLLVLGGHFHADPVAAAASSVRLVLPPGSPLAGMFVWLLGGAASAAMLAAAWSVWRLAGYLRRKPLFGRILAVLRDNRERWPGIYALAGLAVCGFLLTLFVHLTEETIYHQEADLVDRAVIWLVRTFATPAADQAMIVVTAFGSGVVYAVLAPLAAGWLLWLRKRRETITLLICLGGASTLNFLLKHLFERARPDLFKVINAAGYSFPSGHAMVSLCFYGMVAYLLCRHIRRLPMQLFVYSLAAVLVSVIGFSRIYLGVHYPSDVLGGYFAGGTWLVFCVSLLWWWEMEK
ncbi:MAG: phosphatase PAP2 family protein [Sporomusaceae bacterium]|nr:phosphatase PAP2 family protein [Sporomusaceae bacterium]